MNDDPDAPDGMVKVIEAHHVGHGTVTATYLGRHGECPQHDPGVPHAPCWMVTRGPEILRFCKSVSREELARFYGKAQP